MTAGAARRAALKSGVDSDSVEDTKERQTDYSIYSQDVIVDDKMQYGDSEMDSRSLNNTIQAKLMNFEDFSFKHHET